jgi:hypothetical protein
VPHNSGQWTDARFHSFIKGALRAASQRWGPKNEVKKQARVERGKYNCKGYKRDTHIVPASLPPKQGNKRRINNAVVDHIEPVISVTDGFKSWDEVVARMFCEVDGFQLLCHECHSIKTKDEREARKHGKS